MSSFAFMAFPLTLRARYDENGGEIIELVMSCRPQTISGISERLVGSESLGGCVVKVSVIDVESYSSPQGVIGIVVDDGTVEDPFEDFIDSLLDDEEGDPGAGVSE